MIRAVEMSNPQSDARTARIRLGAVSYLNSKPLIQDLDRLLPQTGVGLDYPSVLADSLAKADLDVALIPSVEFFRQPGCRIVSNACVAARGQVMSVKLYCRTHPGDVRTLALDEGSRTSAALAKVILAERYGVIPKTEPLTMNATTRDTKADAVLMIGDRAMHEPDEEFVESFDLGETWYNWTGLPFVFAMWVARPDTDTQGIAAILQTARDRGIAAIRQIAQREAAALGLTAEAAEKYLTHNLHYVMTPAERSGLRLFHELASQHNLVQPNANLAYCDYATA